MRTTVSGYRLHQLLHRGPGHDVWLGRVAGGPETVVIKRGATVSDRSSAQPLGPEAHALSTLKEHPNVVQLIEVIDDPPDQMLVLSLVAGGSLRHLLDEQGTLTPGELVALLHGVASAVEHLAGHGLVHGDLRPDHIVLTAEGSPVLVGMGSISPASEGAPETDDSGLPAPTVGRLGEDVDDPTYLHPTAAATGHRDGRSEVFSLGVMAYECLTGRVPHRGTRTEVVALAAAGVHRPLSSWPSVPPGVAEAVEAALAPDGPDTPCDAVAFVAQLRAAIAPATVVLPRPSVDLTRTSTGLGTDETLPFGPHPPLTPDPEQVDAWRVVAAAMIAVAMVVALCLLAGVALGL